MESKYSIPLSSVIKEFQLEEIEMPENAAEIEVSNPEVIRPGLALSGFVEVFEPTRIQIIGRAEHTYLSQLSTTQRNVRLENLFRLKPVAVVVASQLSIHDEMAKNARKYGVPLLRTADRTSTFMAAVISFMQS